jgi:hypothetical protein
MKRRRTEITIETHDVLVVSRPPETNVARCAECGAEAGMLTPHQAAAVCRVSTRSIYGWVAARKIHFRETAGSALLVCLDSCLMRKGSER